MYIPDPIELLDSRIESLMDKFVDENTCMECNKTFDYEMICMSPLGDGPCICIDCIGYDPFDNTADKGK